MTFGATRLFAAAALVATAVAAPVVVALSSAPSSQTTADGGCLAWFGNKEDGYAWNQWWEIGRIPVDTPNDQLLVAAHTAFIFNKPKLPAGYALVGDGFNMVIEDSATGRPLYAFEGADE